MAREQTLANLLRELRERQGASLRSVADEIGVDPAYLSRVERGEKPASRQLLKAAASRYSVPEEMLALAEGQVPRDIISLFQEHPDLIDELRDRFGLD